MTSITFLVLLATTTLSMSANGECVPRAPDRGRKDWPNGPTFPNVTYGDENLGIYQSIDIYTTSAAFETNAPPAPVIMFVHGGGWRGGSKSGLPSYFKDMRKYGFHVVSVGYRLSWQAPYPAQIDDLESVVLFLKANNATYNLDPEKIFAIGSSAGGHLVSLLGTRNAPNSDARVLGVVDFYGPVALYYKNDSDQINELLNCTNPADEGEPCNLLAIEASPVTHISEDNPPFLIMQGTADPTTPPESSKYFHNALLDAGADSSIILAEGAGHSKEVILYKRTKGILNLRLMYQWLGYMAKHCEPPITTQGLVAVDTMGSSASSTHFAYASLTVAAFVMMNAVIF